MDVNQATTRSRSSTMAPIKLGTGLSVRTGNRMPLGEITVNGKPGQETRRPQKSQEFTIYENSNLKKSHSGPFNADQVQDENFSSSRPPAQLPTFGGLRSVVAQSSTTWPPPPQIPQSSKTFWPAPPSIPTSQQQQQSSSLPFAIHVDSPDDDDMSSTAVRKPFPVPIGSERALSRSLNASTSSSNLDFTENLENLVPAIPSYARTEFRQSNDSILSTSPTSEVYDHSAADSDDSPMIVEGSSPSHAAPTNILMDVNEYSLDIVVHTRRVETKYLPKWNYMTKQPDITFTMRSILVDWLVEVAEEYRLHTETLFLAVNYIDRFLSFMSVQRAKLQLVGTACMFIAAKYEEIYPPDVSEFCYITDDTYTKKQVLRMEHLILDVLGFECTPPTAHFFANHFSKLSGLADDSEAKFLAQYLAELTLLDGQTYLHYLPSVIGAAGVALARHTLGLSAWDSAMVDKTGLRVDDFKECLICLHKSFTDAAEYPQQAVRDKYKNEKYHMVSQLAPTPIF